MLIVAVVGRQIIVTRFVITAAVIVKIIGTALSLARKRAVEETATSISSIVPAAVVVSAVVLTVVIVIAIVVRIITIARVIVIVVLLAGALSLVSRVVASVVIPAGIFLPSFATFVPCVSAFRVVAARAVIVPSIPPLITVSLAVMLGVSSGLVATAFRQRADSAKSQPRASSKLSSEIREAPTRWRVPPRSRSDVILLLGHFPSPGNRLAFLSFWRWRTASMRFYTVNEQ